MSDECFRNSVRRSWEKDLQHALFQSQGQDTGARSASVNIECFSYPWSDFANRYVIPMSYTSVPVPMQVPLPLRTGGDRLLVHLRIKTGTQ